MKGGVEEESPGQGSTGVCSLVVSLLQLLSLVTLANLAQNDPSGFDAGSCVSDRAQVDNWRRKERARAYTSGARSLWDLQHCRLVGITRNRRLALQARRAGQRESVGPVVALSLRRAVEDDASALPLNNL